MDNELLNISKDIERLRLRKSQLETENFQNRVMPMVADAIGQTFVWRNNSCGGSGKWHTFRKLLDVVFSEYHGWLIFESFEVRSDGTVRLSTETELIRRDAKALPGLEGGWKHCSAEEYSECREAAFVQLACPTIRRDHLMANRI